MKQKKKFGRKLQLNKETIGRLTSDQTVKLVGGAGTYVDCPSLKATRCELTVCLYCPCEQPYTPPDTFDCSMFCG